MLTAAAATAAAILAIGDVRSFKDWIVGCDNGLFCQAAGFPAVGEEGAYTLSFARGPNAGDAPVISFVGPQSRPVTAVVADGRKFALQTTRREIAKGDTRAFVSAIRKVDTLFLVGEDGRHLDSISLAGASAAMLYVDEQQRRLGAASALIRTGAKTSIPAPPPHPVIRAPKLSSTAPIRIDPEKLQPDALAHAKDKIRLIESDPEISEEIKDFLVEETLRELQTEIEVFRIDVRSTLALVKGPEGGAYNHSYHALVFDNAGAAVDAPLEVPIDMSGEDREPGKAYYGITNGHYDPKTGILSGSILCRGSGDCGVTRDFVWDGAMFRLVNEYRLGASRGAIEPIRVWRATVLRDKR